MSRASIAAKTRAQRRKRPSQRSFSTSGPFLAGRQLEAILCVLLAVATIALYIPAIGHSFIVYDDREYVTTNLNIRGGLRWNTFKWAFTSFEAANWHPLTWLSHALDYQLFGLNPAGHHLDSVMIHALNAAVLFLVLRWATKRVGPSLLVAALFALHPINVESVAWVAERKNVLSTLFFLLAIAAYVRYARKPDWPRYLLVSALFAAGLMAKPMVITLPFILLLLDYWPFERMSFDPNSHGSAVSSAPPMSLSRLLLEKIPLLFFSVASAWVTLKAQRGAVRTFEEFPFTIRIENAAVAYGSYLWKMLWPAHLAFYPYSINALSEWQWALSALFLITVTAFVIIFRDKRYLRVGWFWYLGTLVPVIGLVQVGEASMADRYAYVPLIGIFIMIAWDIDDWAKARNVRTVWIVTPALCVLTMLSVLTQRQMNYWDRDYHLWSHALALAESPVAHNALGIMLMNPDSEMTEEELGSLGTSPQRMDPARGHFERALELRQIGALQDRGEYQPDLARTLNNLGNVDRLQNRLDEAHQHGEDALKIYRQLAKQNPDAFEPYLAAALSNVGSIDRLENRMDDARKNYDKALAVYQQLAGRNPAKYLPIWQ